MFSPRDEDTVVPWKSWHNHKESFKSEYVNYTDPDTRPLGWKGVDTHSIDMKYDYGSSRHMVTATSHTSRAERKIHPLGLLPILGSPHSGLYVWYPFNDFIQTEQNKIPSKRPHHLASEPITNLAESYTHCPVLTLYLAAWSVPQTSTSPPPIHTPLQSLHRSLFLRYPLCFWQLEVS